MKTTVTQIVKKVEVVVEATKDGFSAFSEKYPGVATTGTNMAEVKRNFAEALSFYLEDEGKTVQEDSLVMTFDIPSFFGLNKVINASAFADSVHMNKSLLAQYITGKKHASETQTQKILEGVRKLGRELSVIGLK